MNRGISSSLAACLLFLRMASAAACPLCNTGTGKQVRAGLFNGHFGTNLLLVLLPIPVFLVIIAFLYFGPPVRSWRPSG